MSTIIVTRHESLVDYLKEIGLADDTTPVVNHVSHPSVVEGQHVIGVLPLSLASLALSVTEIPLDITMYARGRELSLNEIRQSAGAPITYSIYRRQNLEAISDRHTLDDGSNVLLTLDEQC